ncbi:4-(cytidine 5'-diphospho)-2-C-methyl-D-erythritol kinase [Schleiferilactobacillus perolens]|jgi:4-diphosphocytidyl-2-C-methyl-D-erythritol kinase|uniref:4-diphosphocytidyl-2-C-methyl-D-erythritol kinase n=1 Tax=Schleiferilactobacillus perolens DSM 12744 TaxID=1423792 RepID=A0A0R1N2N0_9LACO|nr:4-(cytidine 5'-diphospho)-2-C-methyl-D-erythritol kinase [Schleiferilactobacillus perolens]KRL11658.1 4-diphosphocytidyl-2-C-methyl-D-erythritol kinase [Schleiferilactobacillus perolens DSM 12744]MCI1892870.1 4-(cytidine 5'-diphospho)-2-C-methyl-D-erythritol kinase [Schleiferilactobacillus harbinensis]MCI1912776.1 4-(cytidine 5'-diphospho)-2-C-methyl-D-erythritol kinase [Schleiferilactobacillus harbinensis]MCI2172448.1 4-(cytidine 5'-diphospho)-2-C-methyl-D-erythritol kinase [Schleiferilacto
MTEIMERAAAKINLSLDALYVHPDGLHEWKMVMTCVDLHDTVRITTRRDARICVRTDSMFLPDDQRNLAFQAATLLQQEFAPNQGVTIDIEKHIPVSAGMGGGSADAAAVLRALNRLWQLNLSRAELAQRALVLDSDVPFCVYSETALVTGRGEIVTPLQATPDCWFVIAKPPVAVSTPRILSAASTPEELPHPNTETVIAGIQNQDLTLMASGMGNSLEAITENRIGEIRRIRQKMKQFGAITAQMTGSGPTVFGIAATHSRAQRIYNGLRGFCPEVYVVRPLKNQLKEQEMKHGI